MSKKTCLTCQKLNATLECGLCKSYVCKYCCQFCEEETFAFLQPLPEKLSHQVYCNPCFVTEISDALADYNQMLEQARDVQLYFTKQSKESRLVKRIEDPVFVKDCLDHDEALLRLAFLAVKANYNGLVDVEMSSRKIKQGTYNHLLWSGSGIPAQIHDRTKVFDRTLRRDPN